MTHPEGPPNLESKDWAALVASIRSGKCILMLGPDAVPYAPIGAASANGVDLATAGNAPPLVMQALSQFLQQRQEDENPHVRTDYEKVTTVAQAIAASSGRTKLNEWVAEFFSAGPTYGSTFDDIARLPIDLIINTAPGVAIEDAFATTKPNHHVAYYNFQGRSQPLVENWDTDAPLIYHLYGALEDPDSLVLSDNDHLDFLRAVIRDDPALPVNLTSAFRDPERTFLFLGFRLHHWHWRILMHSLDSAAKRSDRSFALEFPAELVADSTRNFYRHGHKIHFFNLSVAEFISRLADDAHEGPSAAAVQPRVARDTPPVFLCHTSDDKPAVEALAQKLRANGLNTWLDKDDIYAGDEWDPKIERTITNEVSHVVVVQSKQLLAREAAGDPSYVFKEIRIAVEHATRFPDGRSFVIPVCIDGADVRIERFSEIHSEDVMTDVGFKKVVSVIRRDIERMLKQQ